MTYTTGISGTQGTINADGTANDTQNIVVNTNSATLNINGAGGVDKFNIEASSFTKSLTIAGNLGTVPDHQEAVNNYDTVRIDLSKTSGVNLDISKLLVSNPNNEGIVITASKGADTINLVAGANHDIIEFSVGGGTTPANETYEVDLGNLRLAAGQSFTMDGLTITNISGFTNGAGVLGTATIYTAAEIAQLLRDYLAGANTVSSTVGTVTSGSNITKYVRIEGSLESLTKANGWLDATTGNASASVNDTTLTLTNYTEADVTDLNFTFGGNGRTNGLGAEANKEATLVAGVAAAAAKTSGEVTFADVSTITASDGATADVTVAINGTTYTLKFTGGDGNGTSAAQDLTNTHLINVLKGSAVGVADIKITSITDGSGNTVTAGTRLIPDDWTLTADTGKFKVAGLASGQTITVGSSTFEYVPPVEAVQGTLTLNFGSGLLAGQSYTYLSKTVVATKDLTGEEVAEAFAFGDETSSGVDGAVVLGKWTQQMSAGGSITGGSFGIDAGKVLFDISGSSLIFMEQKPGAAVGIKIDGFTNTPTLTGTGTLAVRTDSVTGSTTKQGEKDAQIAADSYVTFAVVTGSAAAGSAAGSVTKVTANTNALDTITNFDVANDKLALKKVAGEAFSFTSGGTITAPTDIYVDTLGSTLNATAAGGIVSFGVTAATGATTGADAITLDQKLYAVVSTVTNDAVLGFEHGGDTYVVLGGGGTGAGTADLVIKLAGVTGVTDITSILA